MAKQIIEDLRPCGDDSFEWWGENPPNVKHIYQPTQSSGSPTYSLVEYKSNFYEMRRCAENNHVVHYLEPYAGTAQDYIEENED